MPVEDIGAPLGNLAKKYLDQNKKNKFIYPDSWGDIVLRNEAWILIENLMQEIKDDVFEPDIINHIYRGQEKVCGFEEYELCCTTMERFWEKVVKGCIEFENEG